MYTLLLNFNSCVVLPQPETSPAIIVPRITGNDIFPSKILRSLLLGVSFCNCQWQRRAMRVLWGDNAETRRLLAAVIKKHSRGSADMMFRKRALLCILCILSLDRIFTAGKRKRVGLHRRVIFEASFRVLSPVVCHIRRSSSRFPVPLLVIVGMLLHHSPVTSCRFRRSSRNRSRVKRLCGHHGPIIISEGVRREVAHLARCCAKAFVVLG
mmetsp:Transcript_12738/g.29315  ORF Transcript_12738/g.29315 Transcript_12738/m.29315 type:complete len:211 (+) Transcript_12738:1097-1729(+)